MRSLLAACGTAVCSCACCLLLLCWCLLVACCLLWPQHLFDAHRPIRRDANDEGSSYFRLRLPFCLRSSRSSSRWCARRPFVHMVSSDLVHSVSPVRPSRNPRRTIDFSVLFFVIIQRGSIAASFTAVVRSQNAMSRAFCWYPAQCVAPQSANSPFRARRVEQTRAPVAWSTRPARY